MPALDVKAIFQQALDLAPGDRPAFLDRACADHPDAKARVEALLKALDDAGSFLETPADEAITPPGTDGDGPATVDSPIDATVDHTPEPDDDPTVSMARASGSPSEAAGTRIGPYKLLKPIGEGGMGVVYMAEQERPVRRKVALKVIKPGMDSSQVIARFEAERQALAMMNHPNIAGVLDAGTTDQGRPYFVMELVKGVPITQYCDGARLSTGDRLALFVDVCAAIQHAHQKGIIHRDVKPSNILVTVIDGKPVPKVIDFGIAKATDQRLTERTLFTQLGALVGTPEYMSPEQAEVSGVDVDTRSDIYSLGVLLYELLTGSTPLDRETLRRAAFAELVRRIKEEEPPRPSTRISGSGDKLASIAAVRHIEPAKLTRLVRGDLDWIVMKALEKDRNRRYDTATDFAKDVRRYLDGDAVEACPPSARYRLGKFARKHRAGLATAGVFALMLMAAAITSTILAIRATRSEARANLARAAQADAQRRTRSALDAMTDDVIEQFLGSQRTLTQSQREFLGKVRRQYESFAAARGNTPEARLDRGNGLHKVALLGERLGAARGESEQTYRRAVAEYAALAAEFPDEPSYRMRLSRCRHDLGLSLVRTGQPKLGEPVVREALAEVLALGAAEPANYFLQDQAARIYQSLGLALLTLGRADESEKALRESRARFLRLAAEAPEDAGRRESLGSSHQMLGLLLEQGGKLEAAAEVYGQAIEVQAKLAADRPDRPAYRERLAASYTGLGQVHRQQGNLPESERLMRQALPIRAALAAEFPGMPRYAVSLAEAYNSLAITIDPDVGGKEIESLLRDSLALHLKLATAAPGEYERLNGAAASLVNLARVALDRDDPEQAKRWLEQALPFHKEALRLNPDDLQVRAFYRNNVRRQVLAFLALKDHATAAARCEELGRNKVSPSENFVAAAEGLGSCSALALKDESRPEAERKTLSDGYGDRAAHWLIQAIRSKPLDAEALGALKVKPDLAAVLDRDDVKRAIKGSGQARPPKPAPK